MLQKELNLQQEQPRKEKQANKKEKTFQKKVWEQRCQEWSSFSEDTNGMGGRGRPGCYVSPFSSSGLCNNQSQTWNTMWTGLVLRDAPTRLSSSELTRWRPEMDVAFPSSFIPWPGQQAAAFSSVALDHLLFPQTIFLCLGCCFWPPKSPSRSSSSTCLHN